MNRTLKALGLGLLAALAISAFAVMGASANVNKETGGHFTTDGSPVFPVKVHGHGGLTEAHKGKLTAFGVSVECTETYTASVSSATATELKVTPTYTNCANNRHVRMNKCYYLFTIRDTNASTAHNTVHFLCENAGEKAEVEATDGSCTITFPPQTVTDAVTYTTTTVGGKHAVTVDFTAKNLTYEKHKTCEFLFPFGTGPHTGASLEGSALVVGTDAAGNPTGLTATGSTGH